MSIESGKRLSCQTEMDVIIPNINATFIGTRDRYGFQEVLDNLKNAKEVRILTYSKINSFHRDGVCLKALKDLKPGIKLKMIVALTKLRNTKNLTGYNKNQFEENSIVESFEQIREEINFFNYNTDDVEIGICFCNHAKLIGTDKILYVGSANYSNASFRNYEAGMIIKDESAIQKIYDEFFDDIRVVRFRKDMYGLYNAALLLIRENLVDLGIYLDDFCLRFSEREELCELMSDICEETMKHIQNVVEELNNQQGDFEYESMYDEVNKLEDYISDLETINSSVRSGFELIGSLEYYADYYEEDYKKECGVTWDGQWIDEHTPYVPLRDIDNQEDIVEHFWTEDAEKNELRKEIVAWIDERIKSIDSDIDKFNANTIKAISDVLVEVGKNVNHTK